MRMDEPDGYFLPAMSEILKNKIESIWNSNEPELFGEVCKKVKFDSLEEYGEKMNRIYFEQTK